MSHAFIKKCFKILRSHNVRWSIVLELFLPFVASLTRYSYLCRTSWGKRANFKIIVNLVYGDDFCLFSSRDIFSLGFGPFRWVCTSGLPEDLRQTDAIATSVLQSIIKGIEFFRKHYLLRRQTLQ